MKKKASLKKPTLPENRLQEFIEGPSRGPQLDKKEQEGQGKGQVEKSVPDALQGGSGNVPEGDFRLSANIGQELHRKLKIAAARQRTTIGELLEQLIQEHED